MSWVKITDFLPPLLEEKNSRKKLWIKITGEFIDGVYNSTKNCVICINDKEHPIEEFTHWSTSEI